MLAALNVGGSSYVAACHYHPRDEEPANVSVISARIPPGLPREPIVVGDYRGLEMSWEGNLLRLIAVPHGFCSVEAMWPESTSEVVPPAARRFVDSFEIDLESWLANFAPVKAEPVKTERIRPPG